MSRMTLLQIVQNILSAIDSDEVNSISDTVESTQVALIVQETYDEVFSTLAIPSKEGLIQLQSSTDLTKPNYLVLPDNVKKIEWIKYDYQINGVVTWTDVTFLDNQSFLNMVTQQSSEGLEAQFVTDYSRVVLPIIKDVEPHFWTTFDNRNLVFDSYNNQHDSILQSTKSMCWGQYNNSFLLQDTFVPRLDDDLFPLLLAEAKSVAFVNLKQVSSAKEEQRAKRQLIRAQNDLWRANQRKPYNRLPNYGRQRI